MTQNSEERLSVKRDRENTLENTEKEEHMRKVQKMCYRRTSKRKRIKNDPEENDNRQERFMILKIQQQQSFQNVEVGAPSGALTSAEELPQQIKSQMSPCHGESFGNISKFQL